VTPTGIHHTGIAGPVETATAAVTLVAVAAYLTAAARLRRRGDRWPWARDAAFTLGGTAIAYVLMVPLAGDPFTAHMAQHLIVAMVAPLKGGVVERGPVDHLRPPFQQDQGGVVLGSIQQFLHDSFVNHCTFPSCGALEPGGPGRRLAFSLCPWPHGRRRTVHERGGARYPAGPATGRGSCSPTAATATTTTSTAVCCGSAESNRSSPDAVCHGSGLGTMRWVQSARMLNLRLPSAADPLGSVTTSAKRC
jgi:hypothetical protein